MKLKKIMVSLLAIGIVGTSFTGCGSKGSLSNAGTEDGKKVVTLWRGDGTDQEEEFYEKQISDFNAQSDKVVIKSEVFPYNEFSKTVRSAISTNTLPDIVLVDGVEVANLSFNKGLIPLDEMIDSSLTEKLSTSAFSRYNNKIYGISQQEGGLGLWANKKHLEEAGLRIPTYEEPWTKEEFNDALSKLKKVNGVEYPLDMKINNGSGYVVYAWQPIVKSFGGDWYNYENVQASGALNGKETIEALNYIKSLVDLGYVNATQSSDTELREGRASLELTGHWAYADNKAILGEDLILIPLPDFGHGSQTGVGGISFGITPKAEENGVVEEAMNFIQFALKDEYQKEIHDVNGSIPVNLEIMNTIEDFKEGGDLEIYAKQLEGARYAVRPESPAFPTYQSEIGTAAFNILLGSDTKEELDNAAAKIDEVIKSNKY